MINSKLEDEIKEAISKLNSQLHYYEGIPWSSQQRTPNMDREDCTSFIHWIECKLNYLCSQIPNLQKVAEETEGHLFFCTKLEEEDVAKRRFKKAYIKLLTPAMVENISDELKAELESISDKLGGTEFTFNNVKKKIKLVAINK